MAEHEFVEDYDSPDRACRVEGCEEREDAHPVDSHYFAPNAADPATAATHGCWAVVNTLGHPMICGRSEAAHTLGRAPRG